MKKLRSALGVTHNAAKVVLPKKGMAHIKQKHI
jgi:hypothetical protein